MGFMLYDIPMTGQNTQEKRHLGQSCGYAGNVNELFQIVARNENFFYYYYFSRKKRGSKSVTHRHTHTHNFILNYNLL